MAPSSHAYHPPRGSNKSPSRSSCPPAPRRRQFCHSSSRPTFRMRPALLPPLVIPKRHSTQPVLLEKEMAIPQYRPSYQSLPPRPRPQPRPELKLDDFDDIDVFNFYNPCLLPPSPIKPVPVRASTDPGIVELPAHPREPSPCADLGLRRWTHTVSRREKSYRRRSNDNAPMPSRPRSRSPSPYLDPSQGLPSAPLAPKPRRVSLPKWEGYNVPDTSPPPIVFHRHHAEEDNEHTPLEKDTLCRDDARDEDTEATTPYLAAKPDTDARVSQDGYHEREQAALRELWGVIDGLLGPGSSLGDYDAKSIASSVEALGKGWQGKGRMTGGEKPHSMYGQHEGAWWRAFRQGLLLS